MDAGHDLMLYRQLRRAESKLHETRECLQRKLALQHTIPDECPPCMQDADDANYPRSAGRQEQFQQEIELLQREVAQREADYEHAQMSVRAYFYLEAYPGRLPESELTAGHPAQ